MSSQPEQIIENSFRRKRRRASSAEKNKSTLYFTLDTNKKIITALEQDNQLGCVEFADHVLRVVSEWKAVEFQFVITKNKFYLFKESSGNLKEENEILKIDNVYLSHQTDNFILLRMKNKSDILLISRNKMQIAAILARLWERTQSSPITVTDRFRYKVNTGKKDKDGAFIFQKYAIVFTRSDIGVETSIYLDNQRQ